MQVNSFEPLIGDRPLVLILGSAPSILSLKTRQYYGNERNHFWHLVCAVLEEPEDLDYESRLVMLKNHRIALWDIVGTCIRPGSLDKNIREVEPNDVDGLIRSNPSIRAVCFNGTAARTLYFRHRRNIGAQTEVEYLTLPSSSPIPRRYVKTFEDKLDKWLEIRKFLE